MAHKVAFCNGVWAEYEGMDEHGCCYVRVAVRGDRAPSNYKGWRVSRGETAEVLRAAGLGVVCSRDDHIKYLWGKALYILPLAIVCNDLDLSAREAVRRPEWAEWFTAVLERGRAAIGSDIDSQIGRAHFLCDRLPVGWRPSSSVEEVEYFRRRLCAD